jgi:hypothetical protein
MNLHALSLAWMLVASTAHAQDEADPDAREAASAHFQRGIGLFAEEDYDAALVEFERAYDALPAWPVLYNIGHTQLARRRYADSLRAFERYLEEGGAEVPPERRAEVEHAIGALRDRTGYIVLSVNVDDAEIRIDGELVGRSPLEGALALAVGNHRVEARAPGYDPGEQSVTLAGQDRLEVNIELVERRVVVTPTDEESHTARTLGIVGLVLTGALAATAIVTGVLALQKHEDLETLLEAMPADVQAVEQARDDQFALALPTDIMIGAAAAIGIASIIAIIADGGSDDEEEEDEEAVGFGVGSLRARF